MGLELHDETLDNQLKELEDIPKWLKSVDKDTKIIPFLFKKVVYLGKK